MEGSKFNRAILMNIGFYEAMKRDRFECVIFHDVDLLPENDKNIYSCPAGHPRHMSAYIDKFDYEWVDNGHGANSRYTEYVLAHTFQYQASFFVMVAELSILLASPLLQPWYTGWAS